ncbi:MAG: glycosyltransferase family 39 protein [Bacteroidales bacterium]
MAFFPFFGLLDTYPIQHWDEAQLAVNAQEMNQNGKYLVTYYEGTPDMWNTKPPFMIWCQVGWMKLIGENELAVRLPSAIAAMLTCFLLFYFSKNYLKNSILGFIAALVLMTSWGYVEGHAVRTGDYDAMVSLFTTAYCLFYFLFLERKQNKYIYLFALGFTLAVFTKSIVGLLFFLPLAIYTVFTKKTKFVLSNKHLYIASGLGFLLIAAYYLGRESLNPGYLQAVWDNDLLGRFSQVKEGHRGSILFYIKHLALFQYGYWMLFAGASAILALSLKNPKLRKLMQFMLFCILGFFCVITVSETKIPWYTTPLFPLLALLSSLSIYFVYDWLKTIDYATKKLKYNVLPCIFLCLIFVLPYAKIVIKSKENPFCVKSYYAYSTILQKAVKGECDVNTHRILHEEHNSYYDFYVHILKQKGVDIDFVADKKNMEAAFGKKIIVQQAHLKKYIEAEYIYEKMDSIENVIIYKIHGRK